MPQAGAAPAATVQAVVKGAAAQAGSAPEATALAGPKAESLNAVLDGWRARLAGMAQRGVALERATLTAAFGRAFGYYDGYLFEIRSASLGDERPVAAGGRYDGLPLKLGIGKLGVATDTGAVGFMIRPARAYAGGGE